MNGNQYHLWQGNFSINKYFLIIGIFLSLLFASLEPNGSQGLGKLLSLPFWAIHMFVGIGILIWLQKLTFRFGILRNEPLLLVLLNACLGAIVFSVPAHYLDYLFGMRGNENPSLFSYDFLNELGGVFIPVASIWVFINGPWLLQLDFNSNYQHSHDNAPIESPKIYTPNKKTLLHSHIAKDDVIAMSSELHYLRVFTANKQHLILGSLKDAMTEFPDGYGIQIHRSHWVSKKKVKSLEQTSSGIVCILENELSFPVSRRKKSEITNFLKHL